MLCSSAWPLIRAKSKVRAGVLFWPGILGMDRAQFPNPWSALDGNTVLIKSSVRMLSYLSAFSISLLCTEQLIKTLAC